VIPGVRQPCAPLRCKEKAGLNLLEPDLDAEDEPDADGRGPVVRCRQCLARITTTAARTELNGQHKHVFFNPHGLVYEVCCFRVAPGCAHVGSATAEFTWFPGYAWRVAVCAACHTHLGWRFTSADSAFFGLICDALVEDEEE